MEISITVLSFAQKTLSLRPHLQRPSSYSPMVSTNTAYGNLLDTVTWCTHEASLGLHRHCMHMRHAHTYRQPTHIKLKRRKTILRSAPDQEEGKHVQWGKTPDSGVLGTVSQFRSVSLSCHASEWPLHPLDHSSHHYGLPEKVAWGRESNWSLCKQIKWSCWPPLAQKFPFTTEISKFKETEKIVCWAVS